MARCVALVRGAPGTETELQVAGVVRFEQVCVVLLTCVCVCDCELGFWFDQN